MTLMAVAISASLPMIGTTYRATQITRNESAILAEVDQMFSQYQAQSVPTLLANINPNVASISNNQTAVQNIASHYGHATYQVTFTAVKTGSVGAPEAVKIKINVTQQRGLIASRQYSFETLVTQVS